MKLARTISDYRALREQMRDHHCPEHAGLRHDRPDQRSARLALVPTMGALHAGHRALLERARTLGDLLVVSLFVNPLQFGPNEDFDRYPRTFAADLAVCEEAGADIVFAPGVDELYSRDQQVTVTAGHIGTVFEGRTRPGHFDGVLTVVLKLIHILGPEVAIFGQKDAQQLACIKSMVTDLNLDLDIEAVPTVREPDGLALSSRNQFLSPLERSRAVALSAALRAAQGQPSVVAAREAATAVLAAAAGEAGSQPANAPGGEPGVFELDYAALVNPTTFTELAGDSPGPGLFIVAARFGTTRLIDNVLIDFASVR